MQFYMIYLQNFLNFLGNYVPNQYNEAKGCIHCYERLRDLPEKTSEWPKVLVGLFVMSPTPFLAEAVLKSLNNLNYPKNLIHLLVYNKVYAPYNFYLPCTIFIQNSYHEGLVSKWSEEMKSKYLSVQYTGSDSAMSEAEARTACM